MPLNRSRRWVVGIMMPMIVFVMLAVAGSASAELTGEFTKFEQCPYNNEEVARCLYSVTEGGEALLGSKKVPVENPAVLQGGFGDPDPTTKFSKFFAAKNGVTLSKAAQPVPGGLAGIVPPEKSPPLVKEAIAFFFENGLTGVNSTLELAQGPEAIKISEAHLAQEIGVALYMPIKVRLENPFLGNNCYVGSSTSPIIWELTAGFTADKKLRGSAGELELLEEGTVLRLDNAVLLDNAWSAPAATGCGGILSLLVDPIINAASGLPSEKGKNVAILENTINVGNSLAVKLNDEGLFP